MSHRWSFDIQPNLKVTNNHQDSLKSSISNVRQAMDLEFYEGIGVESF